MVTKDTVDEDIYMMQQRKAKMNAVIMDNDDEFKKSLKHETKQVLEIAVNRYLQSPKSNTTTTTGCTSISTKSDIATISKKENYPNGHDVIELL